MRIRIRGFCFVGLAVAIALAGCGGTTAPVAKSPEADASQPGGGAVVADAARAKSQDDGSLTTEEYVGFGLPAVDRDWSGDDLTRAESVLSGLSKRGYQILPKYQSDRSGAVFARMTSVQNLTLLRNKSQSVDARFPQAIEYYDAGGRICKLYLAAYLKQGVKENELIELMGMQLRLAVVMLELVDEFLPTLKQNDPTYQSRLQGLEQMKQGLASVVAGSLQTLRGRGKTSQSEIARLVGYMQETFPRVVPRLPLDARVETLVEVTRLRDDPAMQDVLPQLQELQSQVKAALAKETDR